MSLILDVCAIAVICRSLFPCNYLAAERRNRTQNEKLKLSLPSTSSYTPGSNPISSFFPFRTVGARRLPEGPIITARRSSRLGLSLSRRKRTIFFPFAAMISETSCVSLSAASGPMRSLRASTSVFAVRLFFARNSCVFPHVIQPGR